MANWQIALAIGLTIGVIGALWISRSSARKQPIRGGATAKVLHYLGCAFQTASAPTALATAILLRDVHLIPRLLTGIGLAFGCVGASLICLFVLAILENRAPVQSNA